ncbi:hypothetical protein [uncultured Hyphomicrobium sp.]|uniref:hypothetical protein n=1 Tax=uncultured Hyphomicrobium sp. TaxID=194373 RepID=UPI0025DC58E2|nr:hypothetical protein [uncultured Hyphomicrobium sp.]
MTAKDQEYDDYVDTLISNCGTAAWLAEMAADLKGAADHLKNDEILAAYHRVRAQVANYAGGIDKPEDIDRVIGRWRRDERDGATRNPP